MSKLPNFQEFESSLTPAKIRRWVEITCKMDLEVQLPVTSENVDDFLSTLACYNSMVNREMLRDYHEWLIKELEQCSLRLVGR